MSHAQPPHGTQPYGEQPGTGQEPPIWQGYPPPGGYYQQPALPPRRRRHVARNVILGAIGLIVVIVVAAALASKGSPPTVNTTATTPAGGGTHSPAPPAGATAHVGSTISLTGNSAGEKMAVTVVKVIPRAQGSDEFNTPDAGKRFYAVQFRLTDTGSIAYSDAPSNGAQVVDSAGQSYQADVFTVAGCQSFPGTENIAVGGTGLGCVVFQVPRHAKITEIQFTLDSGLAGSTGQWKV